MKTYRIYTPWNSLVIEAATEKQAKIEAIRQLMSEIKNDGASSLDAEEIEEASHVNHI